MLRDAYCADSLYASKMKLILSRVLEGSLLCDLHLLDSFFSLVPVSKWFLFFRPLLPAPADKDGMEYCCVCDDFHCGWFLLLISKDVLCLFASLIDLRAQTSKRYLIFFFMHCKIRDFIEGECSKLLLRNLMLHQVRGYY